MVNEKICMFRKGISEPPNNTKLKRLVSEETFENERTTKKININGSSQTPPKQQPTASGSKEKENKFFKAPTSKSTPLEKKDSSSDKRPSPKDSSVSKQISILNQKHSNTKEDAESEEEEYYFGATDSKNIYPYFILL